MNLDGIINTLNNWFNLLFDRGYIWYIAIGAILLFLVGMIRGG